MSDVSNLVKQKSYDAKISDIKNKSITAADYNKFTKVVVADKIKSEEQVNKSDIVSQTILIQILKKVGTLATKPEQVWNDFSKEI